MNEEQRPWKVATRPSEVEPLAVVRVFRVPPEAAGTRVDVFLTSQLRNTSRTRAKLIADNSAYTIDGRKLTPSDRVRGEDHVAIWRLPPDEADEPAELPILYQDPYLIAIDKPPMLAVHPTARHHNATVIKLLEARTPGQFFSLIHRIDRETSGILLCGLTRASDRAFKRLIEDRSIANSRGIERDPSSPAIRKTYLAITWGVPKTGLIDLPLIRDPENPLRVKMRVLEGGLESRTDVTVVGVKGRYALVRCDLLTGRQHQIRLHLASVGCPIVGDKLYGPDERMLARAADRELTDEDHARLELPRHALHAHRYRLPHAVTGGELDVTSPLPPDLKAFWESRPET